MCGLAGFIDTSRESDNQQLAALVSRMAETLRHRGPDDDATWTDAQAGIALGFRRLAILDLTESGRQPMHSSCERFVIVFNGEIYNHGELRHQLEMEGHRFRGRSDTEVMLAAVSQWGLQPALQNFNGMFAFALWDRQQRQLHLVRDRLGEKPLYYGWMGTSFLFGSELKSLKAYPGFRTTINRSALTLYFRHNCVPAPHSIYEGIFKLPPATVLTLDCSKSTPALSSLPYWALREVAVSGLQKPFAGSEIEAVTELERRLAQSVRSRMIADVPLGAFLSGGVDSSAVVALMQSQSSRPIQTFCLGSSFDDYNEAEHARAVAKHLGTAHTEVNVMAEDALGVIPQLARIYDEPFADSSQIPTLLVSRLARQHVTVSLSGDGGDELFGGYNRYVWGANLWNKFAPIPFWLRSLGGLTLNALSPRSWQRALNFLEPALPSHLRQRHSGDKLQKLAEALSARSPEHLYLRLISHWDHPATLVLGASEPSTTVTNPRFALDSPELAERMMFLDTITYLPDDILVKLDRASMAVSLEARTPLLDHTLLEFAWSLPRSLKIRDNQGKWILRQVLYKYVPQSVLERPKAGFAVPLDAWLRGPLRYWAEALLDESRLKAEGYLAPAPIRKKWSEHLTGRRNWQYQIWDVLMFQAWLENSQKASL
ncbi:MAG TPA: asparagine synthase (glutamine-hydrolyzing) [Terriglobia bacterium]|nr:asparagine synthase (glutamine-hydrolyzing) [Terriglobia bacterium]